MTGSVTINLLPDPVAYNITTASPQLVCSGDDVTLDLDNSDPGTTYEILVNGVPSGTTAPGIAGPLSITLPGASFADTDVLTIEGQIGTCATPMTGSVTISLLPDPTAQNITTADPLDVCTGDDAVIDLDGSEVGVTYEILVNGVPSGTTAPGTGAAISITLPSASFADTDVLTVEGQLGVCTTPMTGSVTINLLPIPTAGLLSSDPNDIICVGDNVTFTATPAGADNYEFFVDAASVQNGASDMFTTTSLNNGETVTVEVTVAGCTDTSPGITVTVNPAVSITVDMVTNTSACLGSDGAIDISVAGGNGVYSYLWSPDSEMTQDISGKIAGLYSVTATDGEGCVGTANNIAINDPLLHMVSVDAITDVSCNGGSNGAIDISISGSAGPFTYLWAPDGEITQDISGKLAGSYGVTVTDVPSGCVTSVGGIVVNQPTTIKIDSEAFTDVTCFGASDGTITIIASGGTAPLNYTLNPGAITNGTGVFGGLVPNTYDVTVDDINNCGPLISSNISIASPSAINPMLMSSDPNDTICIGASVTFTATPAGADIYDFFINRNLNPVPTQSGAGDMFTTTTLVDGDTVTVDVRIGVCTEVSNGIINTVITTPSVTLTQDNIGCLGSPVTLTATLGFDSYEFRDGIAGPVLSGPGSANQFTSSAFIDGQVIEVDAMSACGSATDTIMVSVSSTITPSINLAPNQNPSCPGDTVIFTASPTDGGASPTFKWFVNGVDQAAASDTIFSIATLSDSDSVSVRMIVDTTLTCAVPDSVQADSVITILPSTDPACGGAANCGVFKVSIDTLNLVRPRCDAPDIGAVTFLVTGGSGSYTFVLTDSAGFSQGLTGSGPFVFASLTAAQYYYQLDDGSNTCSLPFTLDQETIVQATASNFGDVSCFGDSTGTAIINATNFSGGSVEYSFDNGIIYHSVTPGNQVSNLPPNGTYTLLVRDDAADACPDSVQVTINNANAEITAAFQTSDASCSNNDGSIEINSTTGGVAPYTYILDSLVFTSLPPNSLFDSLSSGTHVLEVIDAISCQRTYNIVIPGASLITFATTAIAPDCSGTGQNGSITIQIDSVFLPGSFEGGISPDQAILPQLQPVPNNGLLEFSGLGGGQYFVTVQEVGGCLSQSVVDLTGGAELVDFDLQTVCSNGSQAVVLTNIVGQYGSPLTIEIFKLGETTAVDTIGLSEIPSGASFLIEGRGFLEIPGTYNLRLVQTQTACTFTSVEQLFVVEPSLSATIGDIIISLPDQSTGLITVTEISGGFPHYVSRAELVNPTFPNQSFLTDWDTVEFNDESLVFEIVYQELFAGEYFIEIMDSAGCFVELVVQLDFDKSLFVPNVFTPNDDAVNDILYIRNLPENTILTITNRWGRIIYQVTDYQNDWDGEQNADGVYFYNLAMPGGEESYSGWIEIVRGNSP